MTDAKAKIFIVDDHPLVREWLANLIEKNADITVCGEAEDIATALRLIGEVRPDLAIIDISLGGDSGIDLIRKIHYAYPHIGMIVLLMHDESANADRTFRAGARGHL